MDISSLAVGKLCWCEISVWNTTVLRAVRQCHFRSARYWKPNIVLGQQNCLGTEAAPSLHCAAQEGQAASMEHLLVSLPGCCSSCPWPGSGPSAWQRHVPQRCHLCFGAGCSGEHVGASLCQCPLRSICRFVVTAEQTLFSQQPHCLTLPNGHIRPLSPEMPWYWKNTKLDETPIL